MATLKDAVNADLSGYEMSEPVRSLPSMPQSVRANTFLRCPLPPFGADVDALRQFEGGAVAPQIRLIPLPIVQSTTTVTTGSGSFVNGVSGGSSSSSSSASGSSNLTAVTVLINAGTLTPLASFQGSVAMMKKSFQLLSVSASSPCEVRFYGTTFAQLSDAARVTDAPVPAEVSQNIVTDVVFDTVPYNWTFQNIDAVNGDSPQTDTLYVTVVNPDPVNTIAGLSVILVYLPLEI